MSWDFKLICGPLGGVTEGPAWDGSGLLFTHIPASRIFRYDPSIHFVDVFRENTNCANGLMFDKDGILYACEGDARRVVRYSEEKTKILVDSFEGKLLNIPNDLAIDQKGSIWFTDPFYSGAAGSWSEDENNQVLSHDSIYRLDQNDKDQWSISRMTFDTTKPNGLLFSLDYSVLYVAQSARDLSDPRELRGYPVRSDGTLGDYVVLHDFGKFRGVDGMCLDIDGNIVATAGDNDDGGPGSMIYIFAPDGTILEQHPVPAKKPTNCTFGGDDLKTLYITTIEGHLFSVETNRKGRLLFP